jgi:hypothetical protein
VGKVTWGGDLDAKTIDKADRSQFKPYAGPPVPDGLYCWRVKVLKRGKSSNKNDQLIVGLELVPRQSRPDERAYAGYFVTDYITLTEAAAWRVAGFTDAIGVTGADLIQRTKDTGEKDAKGSVEIVSIGSWKHTKKALVLAQIAKGENNKGKPVTDVKGYWAPEALTEDPTNARDDEDEDDEDEDDEDGSDDAEAYTREELKEMKLKDLKALYLATCEEEEVEPEDLDDIKKGKLIDLYLALVEDDDDEDDEDDDSEDDTEEEAKPEPPKKAAKGKAKSDPPKVDKGKKGKAKKDDDEDDNAPF